MAAARRWGTLVALAAVLLPPGGSGFNLHPVPHRVLTPNLTHSPTHNLTHGRSFGHQVLQLDGDRLLVGAPVGGRLFQCHVRDPQCHELESAANVSQTHLGMALAQDGNDSIACGPGLTRSCDRNVHSSGVCVRLDPQLRPLGGALRPAYQGCLLGMVDLVFLFDGSNSMSPEQFGAIRDFMVEVMEQLQNSSIRFGAVQFSAGVRPQFSLGQFAARPLPRQLLAGLQQMRGLTDTFGAIQHVLQHTFTAAQGARAGAKRVIILITDGDATDDDNGAIAEAERDGVIRYVIGVGNNFNSPDTRLYLSQFASRPSSQFVKVLDSFQKLRGLFRELQAKIYDIEGTSDRNQFHLELSSSGLSLAVLDGRRVTGAVGADNWAGGLVELELGGAGGAFVPNPHRARGGADAYLGYSLAALRVPPGRGLVAAGAPRDRHVGAVIVFEPAGGGGGWRELQTLPGEQVGSYFGASLGALDQGGVTVALLVGAPTHYDGRRGGRVLLYRWLQDTLVASGELRGAPGHPLGGFGWAVAALGDLDGDTLPEVAVGAPREDGDRGAVYIFPGRPGGVGTQHTQRLGGRWVSPGLRLLGRALDGRRDLTGDGVADLALGLEGHVVVLRSRPVLNVTPQVTFDPPELPLGGGACEGPGPRVGVTLCARAPSPLPPLSFLLELEPQRARGRGHFPGGQRGWGGALGGEGPLCRHTQLHVQPCLEDVDSPIRVSVSFSLPPGTSDGPVLPPNRPPGWAELPFAPRCPPGGPCSADLWLQPPEGPRLLLGGPGGVPGGPGGSLRLLLGNRGADAFGVTLELTLPPGLRGRRARAQRAGAPVSVACVDLVGAVGQPWGLSCNLSRPVLRGGWQVWVDLTFDLHPNSSWSPELQMSAAVSSANEAPETLGDNRETWGVPVHVAVQLVASWLDESTRYLNFTPGRDPPKGLEHRYRISAPHVESLPLPPGSSRPQLNVVAFLPHTLPHSVNVTQLRVHMEPGGECEAVESSPMAEGLDWSPEGPEPCPAPRPRPFRCPGVALGPQTLVTLEATLGPPAQGGPAHFPFCSALRLALTPPHFEATPTPGTAQARTRLELVAAPPSPLWVYVGGGAGGLLLLLLICLALRQAGFFQRSYRERLDQEEGAGPEEGEEPAGDEAPPQEDTPP